MRFGTFSYNQARPTVPESQGFHELLAQIELPANAHGALMAYMARGRQYIVIPVGGANIPAELVALSLP